jgi:predicted PurR-regulated permease PerM
LIATARKAAVPRSDKVLLAFWIALVVCIAGILTASAWVLLVPLVLGYLLAIVLSPVTEELSRRGIPRSAGSAVVLGAIASGCAAATIWATPAVFHQLQDFRDHSPQYLVSAEQKMSGLMDLLGRLVPSRELDRARELAIHRLTAHGSIFDSLQDLLDVLPLLENALLTLVVAFFILARGAEIRKAFMVMVPNRYFEMTLRLLYRVQRQTADYLRGQSLDSLANAILIATALELLRVPYALFLGAFAGLANVVPLLGPLAGGVPAVALALVGATDTPWWAIVVVLGAIHLLDDFVIYPATVGGSLKLPAWVVILGVALGSHVDGILGMLVAVPLIGLARGFVLELYENLKGFRVL